MRVQSDFGAETFFRVRAGLAWPTAAVEKLLIKKVCVSCYYTFFFLPPFLVLQDFSICGMVFEYEPVHESFRQRPIQ